MTGGDNPLAEFRSIRMVCKHFGFSADYIDEEMEYGLFWCYLAEALDAEELNDYRDAIMQGGKKARQKWKWATPDHAGTRSIATRNKDVRGSLMQIATAMTGKKPKPTGTIEEYAKIRNLPMIYRDEEGNYFDGEGNPVESKPGFVFIPVDDKVH